MRGTFLILLGDNRVETWGLSDRIVGHALGIESRTSLKRRSIAKSDIRNCRPYLSACYIATPLYEDDVLSTFGFC
jgi:hypothetical protein